MQKLPEYARLISLHFTHQHHLPQVAVSSEEKNSAEAINHQDEPTMYAGHETSAHSSESTPSAASHHDEIDSSLPADHKDGPAESVEQHAYTSRSPSPSQTRQVLSPTAAPPQNGSDPPASRPPHTDNLKPSPPQFTHHRPLRDYVFIHIIPSLLIIIIFTSVLFITLRRLKLCCASLRSRASRASSREERCARRAYRRAARKHALRSWWKRYRRPACTNDYEEKRTLILQQESVLEDAMQHQIHNLITEHEVATEMLRAEEGRARLHHQANIPQQQRCHKHPNRFAGTQDNTSLPSSSSSTTTPILNSPSFAQHPHRSSSSPSPSSTSSRSSLPPPPSYDQELEGDISVVDGFMYSPTFGANGPTPTLPHSFPHPHSHAYTYEYAEGYGQADADADDSTPDSSVVDCSPRMSFDTGRSTVSVSTLTGAGGGKEGL